MSSPSEILVLGAGVAGLACAQRLLTRCPAVDIYEQADAAGGHVRSMRRDGFVFDQGPHISFTQRPVIQNLLAEGINGNHREFEARIQNYWRGLIVPHPAQFHLHGLPSEVVEDCIVDLVAAHSHDQIPVNYREWCEQSLGGAFSQNFTFPYTRKYWTVDASEMSTDWIGGRMRRPEVREMIRGALCDRNTNEHYISRFRYPIEGGFDQYLRALDSSASVFLGERAVSIEPREQVVRFESGKLVPYRHLISSIPLPELVEIIEEVPQTIREAAGELLCTSVVLVNIGVARDVDFPDAHWLYVYDEDIDFARVSFPHTFSEANAPRGSGSIQVETYHSNRKPLRTSDPISAAVDGLNRCGFLRREDDIVHLSEDRIQYANVVFDHRRRDCVALIRAYLTELGIEVCGRYGEWDYFWSDDSILSGWAAADRTLRVRSE